VVWIPELPSVLGEGPSKDEAIEELFGSLKAMVLYKAECKKKGGSQQAQSS